MPTVNATIVANQIKDVLDKRDLTQQDAAKGIGVSYRQFNRIVMGEAEPTYLFVKKLSAFARVPQDDLFQVKITKKA
jgi:transcriptional regulator with XRE-family HTH domain